MKILHVVNGVIIKEYKLWKEPEFKKTFCITGKI